MFGVSRHLYFAQKEGLRKEGRFPQKKDFHTKRTFNQPATSNKKL